MTRISAYIELFIRGKSPGETIGGECPDTISRCYTNGNRAFVLNRKIGYCHPASSILLHTLF